MSRSERRQIIEEIENLRGSRVLSFITADRGPVPAQMGDDAVRPIYSELRKMGHVERLDVFLSSRGGAIDVPWRIANALRSVATEWNILVPFHANSAATLLALGADQIILGPQGELGPIDPILSSSHMVPGSDGGGTVVQDVINVEDIMAYLKFIRERAQLTDQEALAGSIGALVNRVDAVTLGNAYRTHSHIRDVARRMLLSRNSPASEQDMVRIVQTLAEQVYAHGHAISLRDAQEIGLPVLLADDVLDDAMWHLLNVYEEDLKLLDPVDPAAVTADQDVYTEGTVVAVVETTAGSHELAVELHIRAKREIPPNVSIPINLSFTLPPELQHLTAEEMQPALRNMLQGIEQDTIRTAEQAVEMFFRSRTPVTGIDTELRGGRWVHHDA